MGKDDSRHLGAVVELLSVQKRLALKPLTRADVVKMLGYIGVAAPAADRIIEAGVTTGVIVAADGVLLAR